MEVAIPSAQDNKQALTDKQHIFARDYILQDEEGNIVFANKDGNNKYEKLSIILFKERTKSFKVPKEYFSEKMREWIDKYVLLKIPYGKIWTNEQGDSQQELDTYIEIVDLKPEEMEWGVIQKLISLLLLIPPNEFEIDIQLKNELNCFHTEKTKDMLRLGSCTHCNGKGYLEGTREKYNDDQLKIQTYKSIVQNIKNIQHFIISSMIDIQNQIVDDIWNIKMSSRDRFNADGEIAKYFNKQQKDSAKKNGLVV